MNEHHQHGPVCQECDVEDIAAYLDALPEVREYRERMKREQEELRRQQFERDKAPVGKRVDENRELD